MARMNSYIHAQSNGIRYNPLNFGVNRVMACLPNGYLNDSIHR